MRTLTLAAALAAGSMLAVPAFAQSTPAQPNTGSSNSSMSSSQNGSSTMSPQQTMQLRTKIKGQLQQSGFTNIHVIPDSFLVRADNKQGQPVVMIINPNSVFSVTQMSSTAGANGMGTSHGNSLASGGSAQQPNVMHQKNSSRQ